VLQDQEEELRHRRVERSEGWPGGGGAMQECRTAGRRGQGAKEQRGAGPQGPGAAGRRPQRPGGGAAQGPGAARRRVQGPRPAGRRGRWGWGAAGEWGKTERGFRVRSEFLYVFDVGLEWSACGLGLPLLSIRLIPAVLKTGCRRDIPPENGIPPKRTENPSTVSRPAPATSRPVSRPVTGKNHPIFVYL
jgi:hypothetical protein